MIIGIVVLLLVICGAIAWVTFVKPQLTVPAKTETSPVVHKIGVMRKGKGDDYAHVIVSGGKTEGVASFTLDLDQYVGKQVEVTGQYSGTTLYADSVVLK